MLRNEYSTIKTKEIKLFLQRIIGKWTISVSGVQISNPTVTVFVIVDKCISSEKSTTGKLEQSIKKVFKFYCDIKI